MDLNLIEESNFVFYNEDTTVTLDCLVVHNGTYTYFFAHGVQRTKKSFVDDKFLCSHLDLSDLSKFELNFLTFRLYPILTRLKKTLNVLRVSIALVKLS